MCTRKRSYRLQHIGKTLSSLSNASKQWVYKPINNLVLTLHLSFEINQLMMQHIYLKHTSTKYIPHIEEEMNKC